MCLEPMETSTTGFFASIKQNLLLQCGLCIDCRFLYVQELYGKIEIVNLVMKFKNLFLLFVVAADLHKIERRFWLRLIKLHRHHDGWRLFMLFFFDFLEDPMSRENWCH